MFVAPAAEFPNDNPALHHGAIWSNREPCGPLEMEAREIEDVVVAALTETTTPPQVAPAPEPPLVAEVAAELASESESEPASEPESEAEPESATEIVLAVAVERDVPVPLESLIVLSAAPRDEIEPPLVDEEIVVEELDFDLSNVPIETSAPPSLPQMPEPPPTIEEDAYAHLVNTLEAVAVAEGGSAEAVTALLEGSEMETARAWRAVLRGENDDISTCGAAMLDEWAAAVVAGAIGAPSRATALRRELRSRGVCAFGLIEAA